MGADVAADDGERDAQAVRGSPPGDDHTAGIGDDTAQLHAMTVAQRRRSAPWRPAERGRRPPWGAGGRAPAVAGCVSAGGGAGAVPPDRRPVRRRDCAPRGPPGGPQRRAGAPGRAGRPGRSRPPGRGSRGCTAVTGSPWSYAWSASGWPPVAARPGPADVVDHQQTRSASTSMSARDSSVSRSASTAGPSGLVHHDHPVGHGQRGDDGVVEGSRGVGHDVGVRADGLEQAGGGRGTQAQARAAGGDRGRWRGRAAPTRPGASGVISFGQVHGGRPAARPGGQGRGVGDGAVRDDAEVLRPGAPGSRRARPGGPGSARRAPAPRPGSPRAWSYRRRRGCRGRSPAGPCPDCRAMSRSTRAPVRVSRCHSGTGLRQSAAGSAPPAGPRLRRRARRRRRRSPSARRPASA